MSDIDQGTDTDQPADDIASLLNDAFDQAESGASTETAADKTKTGDVDATDSSRTRDASGKFVKQDDAAKTDKIAADQTADKTAADKTASDDATKASTAATDTTEPPAHWSQADKDKFKALPAEGKAFVLDRFKAMEGDYTRKTQEVAHLKKEYGPVDELFAPHKEVMRQKGFSPRSLIEAWANVEQKLAAGPDSAIDVIKGLIGGYQIPVAKIAAALGISSQAQPQPPGQTDQQATAVQDGKVVALPPEVAAELKALREQVGQFGQRFQTIDQREAANRQAQQQAEEQAVDKQVNDFKSAVDEKGQPLHPHFEAVKDHMTFLAQAALASKQQPFPSLKELYETAVWANPTVREQVLTAQRQQEEQKRTEEARAKAAAARKAGSSISGAPGSGQAPTGKSSSDLSLGDTIREAVDSQDAA